MAEKALVPTNEVQKQLKALNLDLKQVARGDSIFNANQAQKLFNSTHQKYKYVRPAKGGGQWTYVKSSYVRRVLDSVFGFNWDFEIETSVGEALEVAKLTKVVVVKGILTGRTKHDGKWIEIKKTQFGRAEVKFKKDGESLLDFGNDLKAATSDALKKCASLLGIASDVYEPQEFMEITLTDSDEHDEKAQANKKRVDDAKKLLAKKAEKVGGENEQRD